MTDDEGAVDDAPPRAGEQRTEEERAAEERRTEEGERMADERRTEELDRVDGQRQAGELRTDDERASGDDAGGPIRGVGGRAGPWTPAFLVEVRERSRRRAVALVVAVVVGVAVAWVHWLGLVVAGALVGLASRTVPRAVLAGLAVGGLVLVVQVLASPPMDADEFLALTPPAYVAVAAALGLPVWGSLVRGVV